jgi:hypothetical protein
MIYLRYRYEKSGLLEPSTVALYTEDIDWIKAQVESEFTRLFPGSDIVINPSLDSDELVDLPILVYRQSISDWDDVFMWGYRHLSQVSLALAFYCIDQRRFELVSPHDFREWIRHRKILVWLIRGFQRFPKLWHLCERGCTLCGF